MNENENIVLSVIWIILAIKPGMKSLGKWAKDNEYRNADEENNTSGKILPFFLSIFA